MAVQPETLFTPINIASYGIATLAVNVTTNTFFRLFGAPPKWTAFGTALVIAYVLVGMQTAPHWFDWVLAFFNACLLFCSALGLNEVGSAATNRSGQGFIGLRSPFKSWF
jgi:hypothetical protein